MFSSNYTGYRLFICSIIYRKITASYELKSFLKGELGNVAKAKHKT